MNAMTIRLRRILGYLFAVGYAAWALYAVPRAPQDERLFAAVGTSVFFLFYVLPFTVFAANVEIQETGVRVEQFVTKFMDFSQLRACFTIFLVPFRAAIILTRQRFPMNMLVVFAPADDFVSILKSRMAGAGAGREAQRHPPKPKTGATS